VALTRGKPTPLNPIFLILVFFRRFQSLIQIHFYVKNDLFYEHSSLLMDQKWKICIFTYEIHGFAENRVLKSVIIEKICMKSILFAINLSTKFQTGFNKHVFPKTES
jgi:hypothetical protein